MRQRVTTAIFLAWLALGAVLAWPVVGSRADGPTTAAGWPAYRLVDIWSADPAEASPGHLLEPAGVAAGPDGAVYVLDAGRGRIEVYREGTYERIIGHGGSGPGQLLRPQGIAFVRDRLWVADTGNRRVQVFAIDGRPLASWTGLGVPWGVGLTTAGEIAVTDQAGGRVLFLDETGRLRRTMAPGGDLALSSPQAVAGLADGGLAIVDSGHRRIQLWRADGSLAGLITSTTLLPQVAVASAGPERLLVAELRTLYLYDTSTLRPVASSRAPVPGGFLAVDVADSGQFTQTVWAVLRSDQLTGLRRYEGLGPTAALEDVRLPAPPLEFHGPERIDVTAAAAYVLDSLPRIQRIALNRAMADQTLAPEASEIVVADDAQFVANANVVRHLANFSETWRWQGTPQSWFNGLAFDRAADRLYVLDIARQAVLGLTGDRLALTLTLQSGSFGAYTDLAVHPTGMLALVNRGRREIELRAPDGSVRAHWPVRGVPLRIAFGADGHGYVLTREGWVWRYDADGEPDAWWDASAPLTSGQGRGTATDLAAAPDGRVFIADGPGHRILVYALDPSSSAPPPPTGSGCSHRPEKWAEPTYLNLGQETTITLRVVGQCLDEGKAADIMLVLDRSGSMVGQKMAAARSAAIAFIGEMNFAVSRVGVVAFSSEAVMPIGLSASPAEVVAAVVGIPAPSGGTDIGEAIELAAAELGQNGRSDVERIIVLLSDGRPEGDVIDADSAAAKAKAAGNRLFTIGFGGDVDPDLMRRIASTPDDYFFAPSASELSAVYAEIARRVSSDVTMRTALITDVVPINMAYVEGSARPPLTALSGRELRWEIAGIRSVLELRYRLRPLQTGRWPANIVARARYVDGHDVPGELEFPVPEVTVVGPALPAYLPYAASRSCLPGAAAADVVLVLDASSSMRGEKLRAAQTAAHTFVDGLRPPIHRAALVAFNRQAQLLVALTTDRSALHTAIDGLSVVTGTVMDSGLRAGLAELQARGRPSTAWAMVVLSDGQNNAGPEPVLVVGQALHQAGISVFTVAFGEDADLPLLRALAIDPARSFTVLSAEELVRLFAALAREVGCP